MMKEVFAIFMREVKRTYRNKFVVATMIVQPLMWLVFFGSSLANLPQSFLQTVSTTWAGKLPPICKIQATT